MSFEGLKIEILSQAKEEAKKIAADLQARTKSEESRILARARAAEEEIIREAEQEGVRQSRKLLQETELAGRATILKAKEEELLKTQQLLVDELLNEGVSDTISALLDLLPDGAGEIVPGEVHANEVKKLAKKHTVSDQAIPGEGGFVFRGSSIEVNFTISHLVAAVFRRHRARIASRLFS